VCWLQVYPAHRGGDTAMRLARRLHSGWEGANMYDAERYEPGRACGISGRHATWYCDPDGA